jgi:hypothetical protein
MKEESRAAEKKKKEKVGVQLRLTLRDRYTPTAAHFVARHDCSEIHTMSLSVTVSTKFSTLAVRIASKRPISYPTIGLGWSEEAGKLTQSVLDHPD